MFPRNYCLCQTNILSTVVCTCYDIPQRLGWGYFRARIKSMLIKMFSSVNWSSLYEETFHASLESILLTWPVFHFSAPHFCFSVLFIWWNFDRVCCCSFDFLFSGAKDDYFCVAVFVCLCGQDYRTREGERVVALSAAPNTLTGRALVYCGFLHIFWLMVLISQYQWKEVRDSSEQCGW